MSVPLPIERLKTITAGQSFDIPDGWIFYSYKCKSGASVVITNSLGEFISDNGSGSSYNDYGHGFKSLNIAASGGDVLLKWY